VGTLGYHGSNKEQEPTNPTNSRRSFRARQNIQPIVKARTVDDPSEARPSTPGSLSGSAVKAETIKPMMGIIQTTAAMAIIAISFH